MQCPLLVDCYFPSLSCPFMPSSFVTPDWFCHLTYLFLYDLYKSSLPFGYSIRPLGSRSYIIYYSARRKAAPSHTIACLLPTKLKAELTCTVPMRALLWSVRPACAAPRESTSTFDRPLLGYRLRNSRLTSV